MGLFQNLFGCFCNQPEQLAQKSQMIEIRTSIKKLESDVNTLFQNKLDTSLELRRVEDKLNNHFAILTTKIDNVIMILNQRT